MQIPQLRAGVLQRALLTRRFVLQGTCPHCNESLKLNETEIDHLQDTCPACRAVFAIPEHFAARKRAILQKEIDEVEQKEREKTLRRLAKERERAEKLELERLALEKERAEEQAKAAARAEREQARISFELLASSMKVSTGDLREPYEIIGPVYFSVSNKGLFFNALGELISKHSEKIQVMRASQTATAPSMDWSFLYGQYSVGQSLFDSAFFVAVEELKLRAARIGADAIVHMRQDIDMDTSGMQYFYLQMYGTAVRLLRNG